MSSMVSPGIWAAGWEHLRATHPMEVVTISIYMTPEALSCTMWLAHTVSTMGLTIASGGMGSRSTLNAVTGDGSLHRQAVTSLKPGGRATTCIGSRDFGKVESHSAHSTCKHSFTLWCQALLSLELQWQCLCLYSLKA